MPISRVGAEDVPAAREHASSVARRPAVQVLDGRDAARRSSRRRNRACRGAGRRRACARRSRTTARAAGRGAPSWNGVSPTWWCALTRPGMATRPRPPISRASGCARRSASAGPTAAIALPSISTAASERISGAPSGAKPASTWSATTRARVMAGPPAACGRGKGGRRRARARRGGRAGFRRGLGRRTRAGRRR